MSFLRGLMLEGKGDTNQTVFHIHCILSMFVIAYVHDGTAFQLVCLWVFGNRDGITWEKNQVKETSLSWIGTGFSIPFPQG